MLQFLMVVFLCAVHISIAEMLPISSNNTTDAQENINFGSEGYIIVAGGLSSSSPIVVASSYAYDINAGTWSALPDLITPRCGGGLVAHQGNIYYISGGSSTAYTKEVLGLKTDKNAWIEGPPLGNIANQGVNALSLNGSLYAVGGNTAYMERFDCSSGSYMWQRVADAQQNHWFSGAAVLDGYIYVCGTTWFIPSTFCERYDPSADAWSTITPMNEARMGFSMVALKGYLYVIGGADANNERYDPTSMKWSYFSRVPSQKWWQSAATDGKKIYVVGGLTDHDDTDWIKDFYVYLPELDIWQMKTPYEIDISQAGAAFVEKLP